MKRHLTALFCILLMPAMLLAQSDTTKEPAKKVEPAKKIVVPFELIKTQHMVVNVKINGKGPYRLIFDTGAPDSLVSNKVYKEAGLVAKGGGLPIFGSRGQANIKEIEIGDLKAENVSAMVLDHPTVTAISGFVGPIEGIIGFTFYAKYTMSIDYEKMVMTFEPNTYKPGNVMDAMMKRFSEPKSVRDTPKVLAPAGLLGIRVEKAKGDDADGVAVKEVMADSPAAAAGFKTGDRLLTLDGRWTDTVNDCYIAASMVRPGTATHAWVLRDGKKVQLKVTVRAGL
jgi:Aspartyl protease/PDZ domain